MQEAKAALTAKGFDVAKAQAAEVKAAAEDAMEKSLHETSDDEGAPRAVAG